MLKNTWFNITGFRARSERDMVQAGACFVPRHDLYAGEEQEGGRGGELFQTAANWRAPTWFEGVHRDDRRLHGGGHNWQGHGDIWDNERKRLPTQRANFHHFDK